jgi:signal transduction histidine kinase
MLRPRTLRGRLALVFGLTTTLLAAGFGAVLVRGARRELARAIDEGLVPVTADLVARVQREGPRAVEGPLPILAPPSDAFAQVLTPGGELRTFSPGPSAQRALITPHQAEGVARHPLKMETTVPLAPRHGRTHQERARLVAVPIVFAGKPYVAVVGTSFDEALRLERELERSLGYGLPFLAGAVALGGWLLTGAMFKPVRSMIEQADSISAREPGGRLSILRGGAELTELAGRLNAMLQRIDDSMSRERAFLDEASHELRTPIAIVRGELELTRHRLNRDSTLGSALDSVLDEVDRLDRLAHNLLVLARSRSGKISESDAPVDLETVVLRAVRGMARRAEARGVRIRVVGTGVVSGDELGLERAAINLLDNAVRFARQEVSVVISENGDKATLEVRDDGPGFDPAVLPYAFDRFIREPRGLPDGGVGLGLAIVAAIVKAHGGTVEAANPPQGGAGVTLVLPPA